MFASIARIVPKTEAEGPGQRFAIWFQGCPLRCPSCCNPEYLPFKGGEQIAVSAIITKIVQTKGIEGVSLLGGEPFAHAKQAAEITQACQANQLSVMIYSGYTIEEIQLRINNSQQTENEQNWKTVLQNTDLLVDGPYDQNQPEKIRRWIGSQNQRVHFLTNRYSPLDPCWTMSNTLEIRMVGNEITVNGFPAADAKPLWKGWKRKPLQVLSRE